MLAKLIGAAKSREATHPRQRADDLADAVLVSDSGEEVRLGELWSDRPAVLVWLRHYG